MQSWTPHCRVEAHDSSAFFEWAHEGGQEMWSFPILDGAEVIDFVAWRREHPQRWWVKTGAALVTSPWLWESALNLGPPVYLVENPEEWVRDPRRRSCILQPDLLDLLYVVQRYPIVARERFQSWLRAQAIHQLTKRIGMGEPHA
jgi:hypothetical protein